MWGDTRHKEACNDDLEKRAGMTRPMFVKYHAVSRYYNLFENHNITKQKLEVILELDQPRVGVIVPAESPFVVQMQLGIA